MDLIKGFGPASLGFRFGFSNRVGPGSVVATVEVLQLDREKSRSALIAINDIRVFAGY